MSKIAYIRTSTTHQKTQRQEYAMPSDIDKTFTDQQSGKDTNRPGFQDMMEYIREGDTVYFESFSRISRSLPDLLNILDTFKEKGVSFVSLKENIDTTGACGKLIVSVLGAISAYEREINAERREYGYRKSYDEGRVGRPGALEVQGKKQRGEADQERMKQFKAVTREWSEGRITAVEAMKQLNMSKPTFYRKVKEMQITKQEALDVIKGYVEEHKNKAEG